MSGHVLTFGETMGLFRAAEVGSLADIDTARIGTGGADSNVAIGLSRLGIATAWVGRVGADGLGRRVVRDILGQGVDAHPVVDADHPTGLMVKEKRTPHTTKVWFYRSGSAGSRLEPGDIDRRLIETAALVHVTGITASISDSGRETVHRVLEIARENGIPVSFDVNHRSALWTTGDPAEVYRDIAARADVIFAGDDEAALLLGRPDADAAATVEGMRELGPSTAVLKRGALGSLASDGGALVEHPALRVPVVDTVGAGDAFVAGFLAGRLRGESLGDCLTTANACGAFACMGWGDWESMPRSEELELLGDGDPVSR
ncbi:sugar kinase [Leifsonia sp. 2TAF2]|uniref:sugar kinase n=1 Tax=Leifsonia sp. 2TAF2 TaxID=3233009 RepID=UPI003F9B081F